MCVKKGYFFVKPRPLVKEYGNSDSPYIRSLNSVGNEPFFARTDKLYQSQLRLLHKLRIFPHGRLNTSFLNYQDLWSSENDIINNTKNLSISIHCFASISIKWGDKLTAIGKTRAKKEFISYTWPDSNQRVAQVRWNEWLQESSVTDLWKAC